MSSNASTINATDFDAPKPLTTDRSDDKGTGMLGNVTQNLAATLNTTGNFVNDALREGLRTVQGQVRTVQEKGVDGIRTDITDYARREPLKAVLVAGGIGLLAALILRRR
jgi:ElaB/YqjD/DUF883 family membrane-anchored ribosome-binding protein